MKFSPRTFTPADLLKTKPYNNPTAYDTFYVQRCRNLYELLLGYEDWFGKLDIERDELIQLAGVLGSYFEDFISEIGIWPAFVRHNQSLYGYPIPFYDLAEYDTNYINKADLAFLIWKYTADYNPDSTGAPDQPTILAMASKAFVLLEETIDNAPATTLYEKYFTIKAEDNFFALKEKLIWFGTSSYLLGIEMTPRLMETIEENLDKIVPEYLDKMTYMLSEPYAFSVRSSFSALNSSEWFAEVARCTPAVKKAIRQLQYGHSGNYLLVNSTHTYFEFRHGQTNRLYRVRRDSLKGGKPLPASAHKDGFFSMNLRQWQSEWWLSGVLANSATIQTERDAYRNSPVQTAWLHEDSTLAKLRSIEAEYERAFLDFFGSRLVVFRDEQEYTSASRQYVDFTNKRLINPKQPVPSAANPWLKKWQDKFQPNETVDPIFKKAKDISMFYRHGEGTSVLANLKADVIEMLSASNLTDTDGKELFEIIAVNMNPALGRYLLDTYGTHNFRFPIEASHVDAVRDIEFFWRFYSPEEFSDVFPMITMI